MQVSYAHNVPVEEKTVYGSTMHALGEFIGFFGTVPCCVICPNPYKSVDQGYVGLVSRWGKYYKTVDPGLVDINPLSESIKRVDIKIQVDAIHNVTIMTKDNVNLIIDCVVYWHVTDVYQATFGVGNVRQALIERTQTTLRASLGGRVLQDCIENRETIGHQVEEVIAGPASLWGVKVESILIKDLQFSHELQQSLSLAATQKRAGEAKVIQAQAEVDSAKLMREASEILNTPAAMQIRYLETLQMMSKGNGAKVIFMPLEMNKSMNTVNATVYEDMADQGRRR